MPIYYGTVPMMTSSLCDSEYYVAARVACVYIHIVSELKYAIRVVGSLYCGV